MCGLCPVFISPCIDAVECFTENDASRRAEATMFHPRFSIRICLRTIDTTAYIRWILENVIKQREVATEYVPSATNAADTIAEYPAAPA